MSTTAEPTIAVDFGMNVRFAKLSSRLNWMSWQALASPSEAGERPQRFVKREANRGIWTVWVLDPTAHDVHLDKA